MTKYDQLVKILQNERRMFSGTPESLVFRTLDKILQQEKKLYNTTKREEWDQQ